MSDILESVVEPLVTWFQRVSRPLPWREEPTPYHVWLSEIMLQQTRIEAVIPYYLRFLSLYPTVSALANADDDALMKAWEGLGYYSRARNLKKAAVMLNENGGQLPKTKAELLTLPGIGDYTAGAIASIAYGQPEPAVDGNVLRVYARLLGDERNILLPAVKKEATVRLAAVYPTGENASYLTQALMELGETVCIPNGAPRCDKCPVAALCTAQKNGIEDKLPLREKDKTRKKEQRTVLLLFDESGNVAVRKRPPTGLLASLYEFPNVAEHLDENGAREAVASLGLSPVSITDAGTARHLFTHIEWEMRGYRVTVEEPTGDGLLFVSPSALLNRYAVASAFRFYKKQVVED